MKYIEVEGLKHLKEKILEDIAKWEPKKSGNEHFFTDIDTEAIFGSFKLDKTSVEYGFAVASDIIQGNIDELLAMIKYLGA